MQKYFNVLQDKNGRVQAGLFVQVLTYPAGASASLFSDNGVTPQANPITTNNNGEFSFYAADGRYSLRVYGGNIQPQTYTDIVLLEDPEDGSDVVFDNAEVETLTVNTSAEVPADTTFGGTAINGSAGSSLVGFIQSGTGATARTAQAKIREPWFSIADFGAVADATGVSGVGTDNTTAIQRALDAANLSGGGVVFIPPGVFRKSDSVGSGLTMYSNTTILGVGDASVIFFDDTDSVSRSGNDMLDVEDASNIAFRDFKILGTALTYLNETNQKQCLVGEDIDGLRITNVTFYGLRYMATAFTRVQNAVLDGNRLEYIVRDGLRCTHSHNVIVSNNTFKKVSDDAVALHSKDDFAQVVPSGFVVSNNTFEESQGIRVLGAKALSITGNVMRRMLRSPVNIEVGANVDEGNTPQFAINVSGNVILDTFTFGTDYVIRLKPETRSQGGLSTQPGVNAAPYDYNYLNNTDSGSPVKVGMWGVRVCDNVIARSLPEVAAYSDYGYGDLFNRAETGFIYDPAMDAAKFLLHGIEVHGPVNGAVISGNSISGLGAGFSAIRFPVAGSTNFIDHSNLVVEGNVIIDCPGSGISMANTGSSAKNVFIRNNVFDLDPFFRAATHNSDNTWSSSASVVGVLAGGTILAAFFTGNVFKNLGSPSNAVVANSFQKDNIVFTSGNAAGDSASNKGVRNLSQFRGNVFVIYDADPTSATYGQITTIPSTDSSTIPTTGRYVQGWRVNNPTPTVSGAASSQYVVTGWLRLTTGTGHVLNTDWVELRCLTGT
jgi:hypothetical protein